jgi:alkanesulfonate monooxygenase SsuD/methylene tetrahydromethanopterin reductase-like flavin-dependent oxidoreductase (luciferase family)
MRIGLALPQYDYSIPGESPLRWSTILDYAQRAEALGFHSLWLSDHLFLDIAKYGGTDEVHGAFEPLVTLAALARSVTKPRLGTLVMCEALRPATVLTKALSTLDRISGGRLDVGIGAGWYEPDYDAIGMKMPPPGERLDRLEEALTICTGLLSGGPVMFEGRFHSAVDARNLPPALQEPRPRVFVGGKGDRLLRVAATHADGWNTCWVWTPDDYRQRLDVLQRACDKVGRDPSTVWRTLGLYALAGEDRADLERRFDRMRDTMPAGVVTEPLDEWRVGKLVGTVDEVREQAAVWGDELGVETLILGVGPLPFSVTALDDVELLAGALVGP